MGTTWGEMMVVQGENVLTARFDDAVTFNSETLLELYRQLGNSGAESVICRAMEELAVRLVAIEQIPGEVEPAGLRKNVRALAAIAEQIGMVSLSEAAHDVIDCADTGDRVALAATRARMMRIGDRSLTDVWDVQDLSV